MALLVGAGSAGGGVMTALTGPIYAAPRYQPRLADQYWMLAHHGHERLTPRIEATSLAAGCAAALLVELLLDEAITVAPVVRPRAAEPAEGDLLSAQVLGDIQDGHYRHQADHEVRAWVRYLALTAEAKVRSRLVIVEAITETAVPVSRWRGSTHTVWRASDPGEIRGPEEHLKSLVTMPGQVLSGHGVITVPHLLDSVALAGLAESTGLLDHLELGSRSASQAAGLIAGWRQRLPAALRAVLAEMAAVIADAAITPGR